MLNISAKLLPIALLVLGCQAPVAWAQSGTSVSDRLHANAVSSFRQGRFPEAYGRFISLADAGHAPAARMALWMYQQGPGLFGADWDSTQDQLDAWSRLVGQPAPTLVATVYTRSAAPVVARAR